jgi:hypothetical protein
MPGGSVNRSYHHNHEFDLYSKFQILLPPFLFRVGFGFEYFLGVLSGCLKQLPLHHYLLTYCALPIPNNRCGKLFQSKLQHPPAPTKKKIKNKK